MGNGAAWRRHAGILIAYAVAAAAFAWPLPLHLDTHFTGPPSGDTGVYVWNQWVFRHEILDERSSPYFTDRILRSGRPANLSLHNYTTFQNLLALPLIGVVGVVAAFNLVYLLMTMLAAYAAFLLARHAAGGTAEAFLAGLLFAWSPFLVTRSMDHFSLVAAAPLPIFLLLLLRATAGLRPLQAIGLGATMWWAASTDPYYGVFCLFVAVLFIGAHLFHIERRAGARTAAARRAVDILIVSVAGIVAAILVTGGWELSFLGRPLRMRTLYNPVLALTVLVLVRLGLHYRAHVERITLREVWPVVRFAALAGAAGVLLMLPVLYAAGQRVVEGDFDTGAVFWRSGPRGVDLLAFVLPNPNHPWTPDIVRRFLSLHPLGYVEHVASLPLVALATTALAWRLGWRPRRRWLGLAGVAILLALGPFVYAAGVLTYVPGPWAALRYVPILSFVRSPTRFAVLAVLGCAVLFAMALVWLARRYPARRRLIVATAGILLVLELLPVPRTLHSAEVPDLFRHVAAVPGDVSVLHLPFGLRDGTSSFGNYTARTQYFQTAHGKAIVGGYLSRLAWRRLERLDPVLVALAQLSEGRSLTADEEAMLEARGPAFLEGRKVAFVVIDRTAASDALRGLAIRAFRLEHVESNPPFELYRTPALAAPAEPDDPGSQVH